MEFFDAVKIGLKKYAVFSGVASRPEYWWFYLFTTLLSLMAGAADIGLRQSDVAPIQVFVNFALLLPQLSITVRRNRDAGFSAWWLLLWVLPFIVTVTSIFANAALIRQQFVDIDSATVITQQQGLELLLALVPVFVPIILAFAAVGIFFFVVSLLPSRKPKQQEVATTA